MNKINIGLIGYGTVGSGVIHWLKKRNKYLRDKFNTEFTVSAVCDRSIDKKDTGHLAKAILTKDYKQVLENEHIDVVIELIGGMHPAKEVVTGALEKGKHVITANKELIANNGKELFELARKNSRHLCFESSVGAGIPVIRTIAEGVAGNKFNSVYGIINGTCNFILDEMSRNNLSFEQAVEKAKANGYAESDPTLDINGMDSTHKLAILVYLAFGKFMSVKEIYTEGISHISHDDIEYAERLNLCIKLLAIAKKQGDEIEARVHPTLISKDHALASIYGINNAIYLETDPLGNLLLSGEGAGQMAAASGVISDLINIAAKGENSMLLSNLYTENPDLTTRKIDDIKTKFYLRFMATDKPGVLSSITGVLGEHHIGINSVTQKAHNKMATVPVIMLTDYTTEKMLRDALDKIHNLPTVKGKPVAIRMEKL